MNNSGLFDRSEFDSHAEHYSNTVYIPLLTVAFMAFMNNSGLFDRSEFYSHAEH